MDINKSNLMKFMSIATIALVLSAFIIRGVSAFHEEHTIRFTAKYVAGDTGVRSVYYILDDGSAHLLGTVSKADPGDFTFEVSFSDTVRVYVHLHDGSIYHEHLYVDGDLVDSGDADNDGLQYSISDGDYPPVGRIIYPVTGGQITSCPVIVRANMEDGQSGVAWVAYWAYFDGSWHQIATDDANSGSKGWSTNWDCSKVADQEIKLKLSAEDKNGNRGSDIGGVVVVDLAKGGTGTSVETGVPTGRITIPTSGSTISECPMTLSADVSDPSSGIAWVKFSLQYDGGWHEMQPAVANSAGWSTSWDCSSVDDQLVNIKIAARNNAGTQAEALGGIIGVDLVRGKPSVQATSKNSPTAAATITASPTRTPIPLIQTVIVTSAPQVVHDRNAWGPLPCSISLIPMMIGVGFMTWKKKPYKGLDR